MRRFCLAAAMAAAALGVAPCGGTGGYSSTSPTATTVPPAGAITIDVVGNDGVRSFSPNPATVPPRHLVVWHNVDSATHRVVLNDGRLDTGNISPGGYSAPTMLDASGPYHCAIHPPMVGAIAGAGEATASNR
jgi:plastocyanin